ncbi:hypothetical protein HXX76_007320 [Chlamydomonas incerta]|uniref:GATA-type domain-containing protein n=1 Tax=Chlamydomonas incerta TaxID=51695 RepID=A0A835T1D4_CHLIN|nr:hypothetical protein HXX76_007320 [Chlamydomonas incerta]|eukprot:KAG2435242.1 hypothetical protein HXX76_007320 [Chlamydomonas incerta]
MDEAPDSNHSTVQCKQRILAPALYGGIGRSDNLWQFSKAKAAKQLATPTIMQGGRRGGGTPAGASLVAAQQRFKAAKKASPDGPATAEPRCALCETTTTPRWYRVDQCRFCNACKAITRRLGWDALVLV